MKIYYIYENNVAFRNESDNYQLKTNETIENYNFQFIKPGIENSNYIELASQEEIEEKNKEFEINKIEIYKNKWKTDGENYYNNMSNKIIMILIGKENSLDLMLEIKKTINPMLEQIQKGNQSLAMLDYLDKENQPTSSVILEIFNEIGEYCIKYYQMEYPH